MQPARIFETVLYAEDLAAAERFYQDALGLESLGRSALMVTLRCGGGVLLIFDPRRSGVAGRDVPSHATSGAGHVAFPAKPEDLPAWREQLRRAGVSIEREIDWDEGGRSIYFRDPAGNSVELAPPTIWGGGWEF
jgi:catechol 2,3-dioxygenase-like lactoylglutathione lyase family enzyme